MVHSASAFRGTRVGVTEGAGPKNQSEASGEASTPDPGVLLVRQGP